MFIWEKDSINKEQEDAILEDNSVLLIACPGSGKTRTLTFKIAYELSRLKSDKEFVIAITYTNRASDEIKERVELLGVDTTQLWIGTIHSFCMEWILKPYHLYSERLKNGFKVINSFDSEKILTELCEPYKKEKIKEVLESAVKELSAQQEQFYMVQQKSGTLRLSIREITYFKSDRRNV